MRTRRGKWFLACGGLLGLGLIAIAGWKIARTTNINPTRTVGAEIDRFEGVPVFYNGGVDHSSGRSTAPDGYNYGLKHQCVEFVKRYYHQRLGHRMPDSYGHAKDFYDPAVADGGYNRRRGLTQHANGGSAKPRVGDLLVFGPSVFNRYGHVAIVSAVDGNAVEIIQQNAGPFGASRERLAITSTDARWSYASARVLGWLRK